MRRSTATELQFHTCAAVDQQTQLVGRLIPHRSCQVDRNRLKSDGAVVSESS